MATQTKSTQTKTEQIWRTILPPGLLLGSFRSKVNISIDRGDYILKTATTPAEVIKAARLRYLVFSSHLPNKKNLWQVELDDYDKCADHLIVIHKPTKKIVGTYRLLCSKVTQKFYSETEFDMTALKNHSEVKVELGRACIHPKFRNQLMIPLLWKGIVQYAKSWNASFLFGCSSIFMDEFDDVSNLSKYLLKEHGAAPEFRVYPRKLPPLNHQSHLGVSTEATELSEDELLQIKIKVPPLLKSYFNAGAKICGLPSWDPEFKCIDYFTLFDLRSMDAKYQRKFLA